MLKDLLNNGIIANDLAAVAGNSVRVTSKPPDLLKTGADEEAGLNLFLYHTAHNTTLRNNSLPAFDARGDRVSNPPLALDLHYLLMAYGKDEYQAEILMGYAMQLLHETPVLSRKAIQDSLSAIPSLQVSGSILPPAYQALAAADLADQIETVKICSGAARRRGLEQAVVGVSSQSLPSDCGLHRVGRLDSEQEIDARLAAGAEVEPVRHAAQAPAHRRGGLGGGAACRRAHHVGEHDSDQGQRSQRRRHARPDRRGDGDPGERGRCADRDRSDHRRRPARRRAGDAGDPRPADGRSGAGPAASRLRVERRAVRPASGDHGAGERTRSRRGRWRSVSIPPVGKAQRVTLYLYEHDAPDTRPARAYSFPSPKDNGIAGAATTAASIAFAVANVVFGDYLAYVSVDGAESLLGLAAGKFDSPKVTVIA